MSFLDKEYKNERIMLAVGIIMFLFISYVEGMWWAIRELISLFLVVTVFDSFKKWLERVENG